MDYIHGAAQIHQARSVLPSQWLSKRPSLAGGIAWLSSCTNTRFKLFLLLRFNCFFRNHVHILGFTCWFLSHAPILGFNWYLMLIFNWLSNLSRLLPDTNFTLAITRQNWSRNSRLLRSRNHRFHWWCRFNGFLFGTNPPKLYSWIWPINMIRYMLYITDKPLMIIHGLASPSWIGRRPASRRSSSVAWFAAAKLTTSFRVEIHFS